MKYADIKAMMAEIAPVIREYTAAAVAPLSERLDAIEAQLASLPAPRDGKDADEDAIVERVTASLSAQVAEIRASLEDDVSQDINDVLATMDTIKNQLSHDAERTLSLIDAVNERIDNLPAPEKGDKGDRGEKGDKGDKGDPGR